MSQEAAERSVAAWYLVDKRAALESALVQARDFTAVRGLAGMWERAQALNAEGKREWLYYELGPYEQTQDVLGHAPNPGDAAVIARYEEAMVTATAKREASRSLQELAGKLRGGAGVDEAIEALRAIQGRLEARGGTNAKDFHELAGDVAKRWLGGLEEKDIPTIPMPWRTLQRELGGWRRGKVHIILAVTSGHKTTMAREAAVSAAEKGYRGLYFVLDDRAEDVVQRTLAAKVPGLTVKMLATGIRTVEEQSAHSGTYERDLTDRELVEVVHGMGQVADRDPPLPLRFVDGKKLKLREVLGLCRREAARGLDLVVVDYVQLVQPDEWRTPERQHYQEVAYAMQELAETLDVAVLLPAQTTQEGNKRFKEGKKLGLGDIRGSVAWSQDAYGVLILDGPRPSNPNHITVMVKKWKQARKGIEVTLRVDGSKDTMRDLEGTTP